MGKTYKFILPQNKEVKGTKVRIENGEVIVDVEFKEKFEPKDGDFLVSLPTNVFIHNGLKGERTIGAYIGTMPDGEIRIAKTKDNWTTTRICRYATPEEKSAFLARLEKECGKRWNAEKKQLEDIRWEPKHGETYWYVYEKFTVLEETYSKESNFDVNNVKVNNCFRTPEAAQKVADQIKEIFKNSKAE